MTCWLSIHPIPHHNSSKTIKWSANAKIILITRIQWKKAVSSFGFFFLHLNLFAVSGFFAASRYAFHLKTHKTNRETRFITSYYVHSPLNVRHWTFAQGNFVCLFHLINIQFVQLFRARILTHTIDYASLIEHSILTAHCTQHETLETFSQWISTQLLFLAIVSFLFSLFYLALTNTAFHFAC